MNEIVLKQKPIIEHQLKNIGESVTKRINELNIENLVPTTENVQSLKKIRAELNKELGDYESQRKFIKNAIFKPYSEFEELYKSEVSEKINSAINLLKDKIASVENKIKEEKEANLKAYFIELCQSEKIDFLIFDNIGLDIGLSTSEKAYKEKINTFFEKVNDDLTLIDTQEFKAEILAEYKLTLNVSKAIKDIKDRKEREEAEAERLKQIKISGRKTKLIELGMQFDEMTNSFYFNNEIHIPVEEIESDGFDKKIIELDEKIKAEKEKNAPKNEPIQTVIVNKPKVSAPVETKKEDTIRTARFEVKAKWSELMKLKQFLIDNKLNYKNI